MDACGSNVKKVLKRLKRMNVHSTCDQKRPSRAGSSRWLYTPYVSSLRVKRKDRAVKRPPKDRRNTICSVRGIGSAGEQVSSRSEKILDRRDLHRWENSPITPGITYYSGTRKYGTDGGRNGCILCGASCFRQKRDGQNGRMTNLHLVVHITPVDHLCD